MNAIRITNRPMPRSMGIDYFMLLFMVSAPVGFFIWYLLQPSQHLLGLLEMLLVFEALGLMATGPLIWAKWRWNRRLPNRLEAYLSAPLSPDDYAQFAQAVSLHPEIKPWIAEVYHDGQITYREAEMLQQRINQYLDALPKRRLDELMGNNPAGSP